MKLWPTLLAAAGLAACGQPAPTAVRGRAHDPAGLVPAVTAGTGVEAVTPPPPPVPATTSTAVDTPTTADLSAGDAARAASPAGPTTTVTVVLPHATTTTTIVLPETDGPVDDIEWLVRQTFPEDPDRAAAIAWNESKFQPGARNGQYLGVMQIGSVTHRALIASMGYTADDLLNPVVNLAVARRLFNEAGWSPWA